METEPHLTAPIERTQAAIRKALNGETLPQGRSGTYRQGEWQTVDSAPKWEWLLTCRAGEKRANICALGDEGEWFSVSGVTTVTHSTFLPPTHWMPLPSPPTNLPEPT